MIYTMTMLLNTVIKIDKKNITLGGVKILTLKVLKSLVVNVDVHLVVILEDKSNYRWP